MARYRTLIMASSIVTALGLAGCGGGGGEIVASTPPPPASPTTQSAAVIGAPALAKVPNSNLFPEATDGGPTIQSHASTVFPLLQTSVSVRPGAVSADAATMDGGATLTSVAPLVSYTLNSGNSALGLSNASLTGTHVYQANLGGGATAFLQISNPSTSNLSWTSYGFWAVATPSGARTETAFVTGYRTPVSSVPSTGSATYFGPVVGEAFYPQAGRENGVNYAALSGDSRLDANFGTGSVTGNLTNMIATDFEGATLPWNSVSLLATISGGQFTGTSAASSAPDNAASLRSSATGTISGIFFGPGAQELGAVWTLSDGTSSAIGSIGASKGNQ